MFGLELSLCQKEAGKAAQEQKNAKYCTIAVGDGAEPKHGNTLPQALRILCLPCVLVATSAGRFHGRHIYVRGASRAPAAGREKRGMLGIFL